MDRQPMFTPMNCQPVFTPMDRQSTLTLMDRQPAFTPMDRQPAFAPLESPDLARNPLLSPTRASVHPLAFGTSNLGLSNPFIHPHTQDQPIQPLAQVQAIILQTPHNFGFTPIRRRFRPVNDSPSTPDTIRRGFAAIIPSDDDDVAPQQAPQPKASKGAYDIWPFIRFDSKTNSNVCTFCEYGYISFHD